MNWRRKALTGAVVFATVATLGAVSYLKALSRDPDKEAALRRHGGGSAAKATTALAGSPIPVELGMGEVQQPFVGGQKYMAIMNSELTDNYTERGWRGAGRSMSPGMGMPSYTVPAGGFDSPLWASACGITAYLPVAAAAEASGAFADGSYIGTNNVYRNPPQTNLTGPFGFWSDQGAGNSGIKIGPGDAGSGNYREPFITETSFYNNVGINLKRQSYSFSFGYNHTNDFILVRHVLNVNGNVDVLRNGSLEQTGAVVKNFTMVFNYDFDIPSTLDPTSNNIAENVGGDDKTPTGMFVETIPRAVPADLRGSGRLAAPFGPRVYTGIASMFDEDDPGTGGVDDYIWSQVRQNFNPLHLGEASLMVLEGNGTTNGVNGDMISPAAQDQFGAPSVGLFNAHSWWESDWRGVADWYYMSVSKYMKSYPGDPALPGLIAQPLDLSPNPDTFTGGSPMSSTTDISTWTAKPTLPVLGLLYGDPRNFTAGQGRLASNLANGGGKVVGQYDNLTLFDLDGPLSSVVPDPYKGGDRKEITSTTGCDRNMIGWGPYTKSPGEAITIWQVDLVGAGTDGIYDVYLRAQDVWMQRKYNPANDTFYWDGSNDRVIPTFNADGSSNLVANTLNLGRGTNSGAVFFPPPPPTLSVVATQSGSVVLGWLTNAENAKDPGTGAANFSKYRVYRSSGFIDQFPTATVPAPTGYNSTIIPPNMGRAGTAVTDVSNALAVAAAKNSHPYARFIQEGLVIGADYNIGKVFNFVTSNVSKFAAPSFAGPYVQIAEFNAGGGANTFDPPAKVIVPNPLAVGSRIPGFEGDTIETVPSSKQVVSANNILYGGTATGFGSISATPITFPSDRYSVSHGTGGAEITSIGGLEVDPRLRGKAGYIFEDRSVRIGFSYWYYVASVDNETVTQNDFASVLQDPNITAVNLAREIVGLESFYTMNANGTDGLWHGTFPFRGRKVGPQVPGQEVIPSTPVRNSVTAGVADFLNLVTVAPNPFDFQALWDKVDGTQTVRFLNMPIPARITIYDAAGLQVKQFNATDTTFGGQTSWDLRNSSNVPVSGGLYVCVIEATIGGSTATKTLKLYVRR